MYEKWMGKRYFSLNSFLREKFNDKVFKISLDGGFSCPNRDGTIGKGGCIFCSGRGSGDFAGNRSESIHEQFIKVLSMMNNKWKSEKYIAYFQAYTNTYGPIEVLKKKYEEAISEKGVVALAIATRPDCLSEEVLDLISSYSKRLYVWVELGLQTVSDKTGKIINRGYDLEVFEKAMENLKKRNIDVVVHAILGLPGENHEDMIKTIEYIGKSGAKGIKIHLLHLMKGTRLEDLYNEGKLEFLSMEEYVDLVVEAITKLPPEIVIHRLTGDAPRNLLIGPTWSLRKWEVLNAIDKKLEKDDLCQGLYYHTK